MYTEKIKHLSISVNSCNEKRVNQVNNVTMNFNIDILNLNYVKYGVSKRQNNGNNNLVIHIKG